MKKKILIAFILCLAMGVFFCSSVFAAESSTLNRSVQSKTIGDITVNVTAYQGYPYGYTSLNGGYVQDTYLYVRIRNNSYTTAHLVTPPEVKPTYSSAAMTVSTECYTSELIAADRTTLGTYSIESTGEYNGGGSIIIGPAQCLYCFFRLTNRASYDTSTSTVVGPALNGVTIYDFTVSSYTDPLPSDPVDLSYVEDLLEDIVYSGSLPSNSLGNGAYITSSEFTYSGTSLKGQAVVTYSPPEYASVNVVANGNTDISTTYGYVRYSGNVIFHYQNTSSDTQYKGSQWIFLSNVLPSISSSNSIFQIDEIYSKVASYAIPSGTGINVLMDNHQYYTGFYNPRDNEFLTIKFHYDVPIDKWNSSMIYSGTPSVNNFAGSSVTEAAVGSSGYVYAPSSEYQIIRDIYLAIQSQNSDDISTDSTQLKNESDAVHAQEQAYYTQNSQAIEATGLRNYNFSQSQGDGIARVSLDFTNLWNSLGTFNSVYIFSLTLGLALTILRHAPNAISRIRWKKNQ